MCANPLYPFGYGLTYSDFDISCNINNFDKITAGETVSVNVNVTNKGTVDAREIVQIYIAPPKAGSKNPNPELKAFKPVFLNVGLSKIISFDIDARTMSAINDDGQRVVAPGIYTIYIGTCQPDERTYELSSKRSCKLEFEITSETIFKLDY